MIYVLSLKDFLRNKKKLVEPKEYIIFDATDDASGELTKFANSISLTGMKARSNLTKLILKSEDSDLYNSFDLDKIEKKKKEFLKSVDFLKAVDVVLVAAIRKDQNIFIVLPNKDFKAYGNCIIVEMRKFVGNNHVILSMDDIEESHKILRSMMSSAEISCITEGSEKVERKIKKLEEDDSEDRKEKKKDKDKKKKKKKKKKDKWIDILDDKF